jgi:hypothetical protein
MQASELISKLSEFIVLVVVIEAKQKLLKKTIKIRIMEKYIFKYLKLK